MERRSFSNTLTRIHKKKQKDHKDQRDNLCIKVVLN